MEALLNVKKCRSFLSDYVHEETKDYLTMDENGLHNHSGGKNDNDR